jgi:murein tripeptide amidase MpaA
MKLTRHRMCPICLRLVAVLAVVAACCSAEAQQQIESKVHVGFNRFYDYNEYTTIVRQLAEAYPELLTLQSIGKSEQGREMWLLTLNNPLTGPDSAKPAMWIDGNVHGNEIQACETVIYSVWYLAKSYGRVDSLTQLIDRSAFYFLPSQNPDGRDNWFKTPTTPHDYRSGLRPTDNDFDGLFDEDGPDDLDRDGNIGVMWRLDPNGNFRRHRDDPRIIERVEPGDKGELSFAGSEGIDNDGDGQINEDGPGGYDMNRNWPTDWQPDYVQFGAGDVPLDRPETRSIAQFIMSHPNIAAGQSYHNAGGMILRGPGARYLESSYPRQDIAIYDRLGRAGEEMLPFYRYMIIHADLYTVHGGFVTWLAEGLGIVSFTNELWTDDRIMARSQGERPRDEEGGGRRQLQRDPDQQRARMRWQDRVLFGQTFTNWTEFDHPTLGQVLIGGGSKWSSRIPPPFMLEEECHRNFAFTMFHADNMPLLRFNWIQIKSLGADVWQITVEIRNDKIIPTRTAWSFQKRIGLPDSLTLSGEGVKVVASGTLNDRFDRTLEPVDYRKERIVNDRGVPGEGVRVFRYLVTGPHGAKVSLAYQSQKARDIATVVPLQDSVVAAPVR